MSSVPQREPLADQIADLIRGSAALREDIADELADHLASHADESGIRDHQTAMDEAVKAFGNPQQIARELRAVHFGAQIMLQKIMIVVLLLVVCVMGAVTYFTWSTTREITAQMASVAKQTGLQLEELNRRLSEAKAGPVDQQLPRLKIRCVSGPQQQAVAGCKVTVKSIEWILAKESESNRTTEVSGTAFTKEYLSDAKGEIDSGPLQQGRYQLSGGWKCTLDGKAARGGWWERTVRLQQMGQVEEVTVEIPMTAKYEVRLQGDILKYWDLKRMPTVLFSMEGQSTMPNDCSFKWYAAVPIHTTGTSVVAGFMSGEYRNARIRLPGRDAKLEYGTSSLVVSPLELRRDGGPVDIVMSWPEPHVSGSVRVDEKGTPARGMPIEVHWGSTVEFLLTDDQGRFESQWGLGAHLSYGNPSPVLHVPWHTPEGQVADFECRIPRSGSCPVEVDLSTLATLRVEFVGAEKAAKLLGLSEPAQGSLRWLKHETEGERAMIGLGESMTAVLQRPISLPSCARVDLLVAPGCYEIDVEQLIPSSSRQPRPVGYWAIQTSVAAGSVRGLRVDVEKLWGGTSRPGMPGQPMLPGAGRPIVPAGGRGGVPAKDMEDKAITVVEPTTKGS